MAGELGKARPFCRRHRDPFQAEAVREKKVGDDDDP